MIETARLVLKPLDPLAAAAWLTHAPARAEEIVGARVPEEFLGGEAPHIFRLQAALPEPAQRFGMWLMIEREPEPLVVGSLGFKGPPDADAMIEIGYGVIPSRRRRGYLTEAATALLEWALRQRGVEAVRARCLPDNEPSIAALTRLGFQPDGRTQRHLNWLLRPGVPDAGAQPAAND